MTCRIPLKLFEKFKADKEVSVTYTLPLEVPGHPECLGSDELSALLPHSKAVSPRAMSPA